MAINEQSDKFQRCQAACLAHLKSIAPAGKGHRKVAVVLIDPYRDGAGKAETFCDEMTRRALNALEADGKVIARETRFGGMKLKVFTWAQD